MPVINFPHDSLYWSNVDNHDEIKKELLPRIQRLCKEYTDNPFKTSSKFCTNINNPETFTIEDTFLHDIVWKHVFEYMKSLNFSIEIPTSFTINYWYNIYNDGDFQEMHTHYSPFIKNDDKITRSWISGVYILDDTNKKQYITFDGDSRLHPFPTLLSTCRYSTSENDDIKEGTVLLFPSTLNHGVMVKDRSSPRITISFNVTAVFKDIKHLQN
jgi:hypothetical protein